MAINSTALNQLRYDRQVACWLFVCAATIFGMILLGGVTRLTQSGLSMVDWHPVTGIIPPLSEADWKTEFLKYQQFPEYQKINMGMSLDAFKTIFWFEYFHRVLGRLIGIMFFIPFMFFLVTHRIRRAVTWKLSVIFILGAAQGALGWYMVKSGLVDNPRVSQYRLTAHLGLAVLIYASILWVAFSLIGASSELDRRFFIPSASISCLIFVMILSGGLVAGTKAGYVYPTFPLMGGRFFPKELYSMTPSWISAFEDLVTIQFNHRMLAYLIVVFITVFTVNALRSNVNNRSRAGILAMFTLMLLQVSLGISTLVLHMPIQLAAAHQIGAIALLSASLFVTHCCQPLSRSPENSENLSTSASGTAKERQRIEAAG